MSSLCPLAVCSATERGQAEIKKQKDGACMLMLVFVAKIMVPIP